MGRTDTEGAMEGRRIEVTSGPDDKGRCHYTLFWWADYTPGHPEGEYVRRERAQCFFSVIPEAFRSK